MEETMTEQAWGDLPQLNVQIERAATERAGKDESPRLGWTVMAAYLFAQYAAWLALLTPVVITIALRINQITDPAHKARWLGLILGVGAAAAMISAPIWGAISDRTTARIGRRKLWIVIGSLTLMSGLLVMAFARQPLIFGLGWLICQIGSNAAQAAFNAVMSDIVPDRQRGVMSALLGASTTAAIVTGVFLIQFVGRNPITAFMVPWLLSPVAVAVFLAVVPDAPARVQPHSKWSLSSIVGSMWINPLDHPDFAWALLSRFLVMLAYTCTMTYQVYYLTDHLHVPLPQVAHFMVLSTSVMGGLSLAVSLTGGWLSDRFERRKPFVVCAALVVAAGMLGTALAQDFPHFLIAAAMVSVGQGLYLAVDIALCVAVLPNPNNAARDMAVLQIASSLSQSLGPAIGPVLLAIGGLAGSNYFALFAAAAASALVGALTVLPIKRAR
jgi:MFS family permease